MTTREEINKKQADAIINQEKSEKRKKIIIFIFKLIVTILIIIVFFFLYITYFSTKGLVVKENRIINQKIPDSFNGTKIIQFSDLHYGTTVFEKEIKDLVKVINSRNPDIVVFTGDLVDKNYNIVSSEQELLTEYLKKIKSSIGKYAITGEEDDEKFNTIFNQSDFIILNNEYDLVYNNDNNPLLMIGLSSSLNNKRDNDKAYSYFREETHNSNIYSICLLHESDSIDDIISKYTTDLFLVGHSHNGQIIVPFIGAISKTNGSNKYYNDFYQLNNSKIFVSGGIGTNNNGIRLFNRPSINLFRLSNK